VLFNVAKIPPIHAGERALAAVRLYAGQSSIVETSANRDILDLRFSGLTQGVTGSGTPGTIVQWSTQDIIADSPLIVDSAMHVKPAGAVNTNALVFDGTFWVPGVAGSGSGGGIGSGAPEFAQTEYTAGDLSLGTVTDGGWVDVDAVNASITITPSYPGSFVVTFSFAHQTTFSSDADYRGSTQFRLTDGTTALEGVQADHTGYQTKPVNVSAIYTWSDVLSHTVKLQKYNKNISGVLATNKVLASSGNTLHMDIFRLVGNHIDRLFRFRNFV